MSKKIYLFEICLFILVFCNEVSRIRFFALLPYTADVVNLVQIAGYSILFYIIFRKKYSIKQLMFMTFLGAILLVGYIYSGKAAYFRGLLLILAAKNIPYHRILKTSFFAILVNLVISIFLYFIGVSPDTLSGKRTIGLGFGNPNQSAQVITLLFLLYFSCKGYLIGRKIYLISILLGTFVYFLSSSRTAAAIIVATPVLVDIIRILLEKFYNNGFVKRIVEYSQIIMMLFTYVSALLFTKSSIIQAIDLFFSNRIFLNWYALKENGITLFGQNVQLRVTGVYNEIRDIYNITTTVDSTYMLSLIIMGLIPTIVFMFGYLIAVKKAWKNRDYTVVAICILLTLYAFSESQLIEIYVYFVYFYIMAKAEMKNSK